MGQTVSVHKAARAWRKTSAIASLALFVLFASFALLASLGAPCAAYAASDSAIAAGSANLSAQSAVTKYTYQATPLLSPFNGYVYVKTGNPDPYSFRLVDKSSKYFSADEDSSYGKGVYHLMERNYIDVAYENAATFRVKGGYIFLNREYDSDGGQLVVQEATTSNPARIVDGDGFTSLPGDINDGWSDTSVKASCPALKSYVDCIIDTYSDGKTDFFERLTAIESGLAQVAFYPRSVYDSSKPNADRPYPFFATSPYPELSLNTHFDIYESSAGGMLLTALYPFVLDSASFPGTMSSVARKLDPTCTVSSVEGAHWLIEVSKGGKSQQHGWGTPYGNDPIYSKGVKKDFTFNGSSTDLATGATIDRLYSRLRQYGTQADKDNVALANKLSSENVTKAIGTGSWARVASEGWFSYGTAYAYLVADSIGEGYTVASDAWVDGRYVNDHESMAPGATFADHPKADIIVRNVRYTTLSGDARTRDIIYNYDSATGTWRAPSYYYDVWYESEDRPLPDLFVLTSSEVKAMKLGSQSWHAPASGVIFDGKKQPGTKFTNVLVKGVSLSAGKLDLLKDASSTLTATVTPANATHDRVVWTSSDETVVTVSDGAVYGQKAGTATITAMTVDGGYKATCKVTVKTPVSIKKATVAKIAPKTYKGKKLTPAPVVKYDDKKLVKGTDYTVAYSNNKKAGKATITLTGKGFYKGTKKVTFTIKRAANKVTPAKKLVKKTIKRKALAKKAKVVSLPKLKVKYGKAKWAVASKDRKGVLKLSAGKVKVKKGSPAGTYTLKLKGKVKQYANYKPASSKVVTIKVRVK